MRSYPNRKRVWRKIVFFFPLVALCSFILLKLQFKQIYVQMTLEDSIVEYLQSIFYFVAAVFAALIAKRFFVKKRYFLGSLYSVLSLALALICLEEITWGQRLLGFEGIAWVVERNIQREFSLHNLGFIQSYLNYAYILVSGLGAFGWLLLPNRIRAKYKSTLGFVIPDRILFFYFFPAFAIYIYLSYLTILVNSGRVDFRSTFFYFVMWWDQEPAELLLSLGFLLFVTGVLRNEGSMSAREQTAQKLEPNSISGRR